LFCLDTFQWTQIKPVGQMPTPRSAAPIVPSPDGSTLFIIGGYSKENDDKGIPHGDVFSLTQGKQIHSLNFLFHNYVCLQMEQLGNRVKLKSAV